VVLVSSFSFHCNPAIDLILNIVLYNILNDVLKFLFH